MGLISWNVRGLGKREKRRFVRRVSLNWKLDLLFIQESKVKEVDQRFARSLWRDSLVSFEFSSSIGSTGGLISLWNNDFFEVESKFISHRFILLIGIIKQWKFRYGFVNLYSPNDDGERAIFWDDLSGMLYDVGVIGCLGGDFNVVRNVEE
ncbi:hypothetical protein REPUB_Repub06bG0060100 [Reevesia pubescens]